MQTPLHLSRILAHSQAVQERVVVLPHQAENPTSQITMETQVVETFLESQLAVTKQQVVVTDQHQIYQYSKKEFRIIES